MRCRVVLVVALFLALSAPAQAPNYEYGEPEEMLGLTKVFVDAGSDVDLYRIVRKVIEKREPRLTVVPLEESQFVVMLTYRPMRDSQGRRYYTGELLALTDGKNALRLLSTYRHDEEELDDLADEIAKAFLKEYRRVNSVPKK
jgi:hypothetical protein